LKGRKNLIDRKMFNLKDVERKEKKDRQKIRTEGRELYNNISDQVNI